MIFRWIYWLLYSIVRETHNFRFDTLSLALIKSATDYKQYKEPSKNENCVAQAETVSQKKKCWVTIANYDSFCV